MDKIGTILNLDYMLDKLEDLRSELDFVKDRHTMEFIDLAIDNIETIKYDIADMEDEEDEGEY